MRKRRIVSYFLLTASYLWFSYLVFLSRHDMENDPPPDWVQRRKKLNDYCHDHRLSLPKPPQLMQGNNVPSPLREHFTKLYYKDVMQNIVHIPQLNLNWCLVPKVASTSISKLIIPYLDMSQGQVHKVFPHLQKEVWTKAGHLSYQDYLSHRNTTNSFLISRHPFARVASAFRNKLEDRSLSHDGDYFYNTYSRQIIKYSRGIWKPGDQEPTFAEFVHYLLNTDVYKYDEHWLPISIRCRLCQVDFTHVIRYESLSSEWKYFLYDTDLTEENLNLPWENKGSASGKLKDYFQLITPYEKEKLYERYQSDFEIFNYSMDDEF